MRNRVVTVFRLYQKCVVVGLLVLLYVIVQLCEIIQNLLVINITVGYMCVHLFMCVSA